MENSKTLESSQLSRLAVVLEKEKKQLKDEFKHFSFIRREYEKRKLFTFYFDLNSLIESSSFLSYSDNYRIFEENVLDRHNLCQSIYDYLNFFSMRYFKKDFIFSLRFYIYTNKKEKYKHFISVNFRFTDNFKFSYCGIIDYFYNLKDYDVFKRLPFCIENFDLIKEDIRSL